MDFINRFEEAINKGHIKAFFQPLKRSISGMVCGCEALARWVDPKEGVIPPSEFIELLEENRLIYKLDLVMLENVCKFYKENNFKDLSFSINLSGVDFEEIDMFKAITDILNKYNVPTKTINLEITESVMIRNTSRTRKLFDKFHNAGFEIWIDDLGSGYSSLNVLRDYKFDVLKIDMSLIQKFDLNSKKILISIVNMAKTLGMHTLAEGVETKEQLLFLKNIGCEIIQGYYFAKPMCEEDFIKFLNNNNVESDNDYEYWSEAGKINFLSADPLYISNYYSKNDDLISSVAPLAFIEYQNHIVKYVYVNEPYTEELKTVGFKSIEDLEKTVNSINYEHHERYKAQIIKTVETEGVQRIDNIINDVVCSHFTKLLAKENDKYLIASSFHTISSKRTEYLVLKYSQNLYQTYDIVTEITPEKDSAVQIYSTAGFAKIYGTKSLKSGIKEFTENEVHPNDRKRYLKFFDLNTLDKRIENYIQETFLIHKGDSYEEKNIRITRLDNGKFLYTIQSK